MQFLPLQLALSHLSFLFNSSTLLKQIETLSAFDGSSRATLDLAIAMAKDTRILETLNPQKLELLLNISSYSDSNNSSIIQFSELEVILQEPNVGQMVEEFKEYKYALLTNKQLVISITEHFSPPDMNQANWKDLLAFSRLNNEENCELEIRELTTFSSNISDISDETNVEQTRPPSEDKSINYLRNEIQNLFPITTKNAIYLLHMGAHLRLPFLVNKCSKFLEKTLAMENIIDIFQVSLTTKSDDLKKKAEEFILYEFEEISEHDPRFPFLGVWELFSLLMSDKLTISSEEVVFKAIVRWVNFDITRRTQHVPLLMKTVRLHLCSLRILTAMLDHYLFIAFKDIQNSLRTAMRMIQFNSPKLPGMIKRQQRHLRQNLFVVGGPPIGGSRITVETFSTTKRQWINHDRINTTIGEVTSAVPVGKKIFVFHEDTFHIFDPVQKIWRFYSYLEDEDRSDFAITILDDIIYVMGGKLKSTTSKCGTFDTKNSVWNEIPSLHSPRQSATAATFQGKVYIAGGHDGRNNINTVEMFDPATNGWIFIASLMPRYPQFALVSDDSCLWAFGHFEGRGSTYQIKKYNPEDSTWTTSQEIDFATYYYKVVYFYGQFYIISSGAKDVVYNPRRNSLTKVSSYGKTPFGACVLKDLPNAADYLIYEA